MSSILSRRCPLLAISLSVLFCLHSMLISDSRFDLVWFRLSCDHGWIRSGSVNVRKQQNNNFVGKLDLVFHSRTDHPVTLHDVLFVPDLGFNLFSSHVMQEKHEIILNRTGAYLLDGRLVFPRRSNGSSLRATRVLPRGHANANTALTTFANPPSQRNDGPHSPVPYRSVASPVAHQKSGVSRTCRTSNAGARSGVKNLSVVQEQGGESESGKKKKKRC